MIDPLPHALPAMTRERVRRPRLPVATLLLEAAELLEVCREPEVAEALVRVGLPEGFARDLETRLAAARATQARWAAARDRSNFKAALREREAAGHALRERLLAAGRWNLRDRPAGLAALRFLRKGEGTDHLVQDLFDLAALFERHAAVFARDRSFELPARVREARAAARALSESLSVARNDAARAELRQLRDRAFTRLDERVSEVRAAGRYAFQGDTARVRQFTSRHRARARRAARRDEQGEGRGAGAWAKRAPVQDQSKSA